MSKSSTTASPATKKNSKNTKKVTKKSPKKAKKVIEDIDTDGEGDDEAVAPAAGSIVSNLTNYLAFTAKAAYDNRSLVLFGLSVPIILFFGEMASV